MLTNPWDRSPAKPFHLSNGVSILVPIPME